MKQDPNQPLNIQQKNKLFREYKFEVANTEKMNPNSFFIREWNLKATEARFLLLIITYHSRNLMIAQKSQKEKAIKLTQGYRKERLQEICKEIEQMSNEGIGEFILFGSLAQNQENNEGNQEINVGNQDPPAEQRAKFSKPYFFATKPVMEIKERLMKIPELMMDFVRLAEDGVRSKAFKNTDLQLLGFPTKTTIPLDLFKTKKGIQNIQKIMLMNIKRVEEKCKQDLKCKKKWPLRAISNYAADKENMVI